MYKTYLDCPFLCLVDHDGFMELSSAVPCRLLGGERSKLHWYYAVFGGLGVSVVVVLIIVAIFSELLEVQLVAQKCSNPAETLDELIALTRLV